MMKLLRLWSDWEIQLLVLLSLTLQIFLFFFSGFRRNSINKLLRLFIWSAYLGADWVAVYTLGLLSRHEAQCQQSAIFGETHPLLFFWTPFLLIHLGGQDTITAFSMEDNNLWLRHLLNLLVQVGLALYVFWKSIGRKQLLAPAIFVFVAGIIKYGERTWALKCASKQGRSGLINDKTIIVPLLENSGYFNIVSIALHAMRVVRSVFSGRYIYAMKTSDSVKQLVKRVPNDRYHQQGIIKAIEIQLGLMYDDLYTKSMVVQTWKGVILRCVSQVSIVVAFVLFLASNKQLHSRADVAITYVLFIGGFCLEICAVFMMITSPWSWVFLEAHKCHRLACMYRRIISGTVWAENRPLWSNSMGQYNLVSSCIGRERSWSILARKIMRAVGVEKLWSNFVHTKHVKANEVLTCLVQWVQPFIDTKGNMEGLRSPNLGPRFKETLSYPFELAIVVLHVFTNVRLSGYDRSTLSDETLHSVGVCEKLSNYMVYLLVVQPSVLPLAGNAESVLARISERMESTSKEEIEDELDGDPEVGPLLSHAASRPPDEMVAEIKEMWIRLVVYAASKCPAEEHAQQLGQGGQLLTILWLLLAHLSIGDVGRHSVDLFALPGNTHDSGRDRFPLFDFNTID